MKKKNNFGEDNSVLRNEDEKLFNEAISDDMQANEEDFASDTKDAVQKDAQHIKEKTKQMYNTAKNKTRDFARKTSEKARRLKEKSEEEIRAHPLRSAAIAAGAGAVLGIAAGTAMASRRSKKKELR